MKWAQELDLVQSRILGGYLLLIAIGQMGLYMAILADPYSPLFYIDPRIGLMVLMELLDDLRRIHVYRDYTLYIRLYTVVWIALMGIGFLKGRTPVMLYIISELVLATPSVLFFIFVIIINMSPAHGFSVTELPMPVLTMMLVTVVPVAYAFRYVRRRPGSSQEKVLSEG